MPASHAVLFRQFGPPSAVAQFESLQVPDPGPEEVIVRLEAAPIHPADLNRLEGRYGEKPDLPAIGGIEGCGWIESTGSGVDRFQPGQRVALAHVSGTWSERVKVPADRLTLIPEDLETGLASMLTVNPSTAWRMLHDFVPLAAGEWVLLNAANSSVGRAVVELARAKGWRTLTVVRRTEVIPELRQLGANAVLLDDDGLRQGIPEITGGSPIRLALNAVGGASALRLANALAPSGTLVTYGAMGRRPVEIPNGLLIFKDLRLRGFWLTRWFRQASSAARTEMLREIVDLAQAGKLSAHVAKSFPLAEPTAALAAAASDRREGKVIFRMETL